MLTKLSVCGGAAPCECLGTHRGRFASSCRTLFVSGAASARQNKLKRCVRKNFPAAETATAGGYNVLKDYKSASLMFADKRLSSRRFGKVAVAGRLRLAKNIQTVVN